MRTALPAAAAEQGKGGCSCSSAGAKTKFSPDLTQAPAPSCSRPQDSTPHHLPRGKPQPTGDPGPWWGATFSSSAPAPQQGSGLPSMHCWVRAAPAQGEALQPGGFLAPGLTHHVHLDSNKRRRLFLCRVVLPNTRDPEC